MEEIHEFDGPAFTQRLIIYTFWLVVQLDIHRKYFNMLWMIKAQRLYLLMEQMTQRKYNSVW